MIKLPDIVINALINTDFQWKNNEQSLVPFDRQQIIIQPHEHNTAKDKMLPPINSALNLF